MITNGCEAGCKVFTGGEIKHHQDCKYYDESMSKMYDDLSSEVKSLRLANVSERYSFENAMYWYMKGFQDAETTESQLVSHEQTMKDAETHFHLVWDCYVNAL